eukprot:GHVU01157530.1.p1 GENE.GHVU01157530.1~~GHVU01157530.1.p1  ORF type:complete len:107 (-),score=0.09 GHVU01157530.1:539-859(-)
MIMQWKKYTVLPWNSASEKRTKRKGPSRDQDPLSYEASDNSYLGLRPGGATIPAPPGSDRSPVRLYTRTPLLTSFFGSSLGSLITRYLPPIYLLEHSHLCTHTHSF